MHINTLNLSSKRVACILPVNLKARNNGCALTSGHLAAFPLAGRPYSTRPQAANFTSIATNHSLSSFDGETDMEKLARSAVAPVLQSPGIALQSLDSCILDNAGILQEPQQRSLIGAVPAEAGRRRKPLTFRNLCRRLFTGMDPTRIHAVSASLYMLYATYETFRVMYELLVLHHTPVAEAEWILPAIIALTAAKDATGAQMGMKYRRGAERDVFVASCFMDFVLTLNMAYFAPHVNADFLHTFKAIAVMCFPCAVYGAIVPVLRGAEILKGREREAQQQSSIKSDSQNSDMSASLNMIGYLAPAVLTGYFATLAAYHMCFGDLAVRELILQQCPEISLMFGPIMVGLWWGNVGTFSVTLRDKHLLSQRAELALTAGPFIVFLGVMALTLGMFPADKAMYVLHLSTDPTFFHSLCAQVA